VVVVDVVDAGVEAAVVVAVVEVEVVEVVEVEMLATIVDRRVTDRMNAPRNPVAVAAGEVEAVDVVVREEDEVVAVAVAVAAEHAEVSQLAIANSAIRVGSPTSDILVDATVSISHDSIRHLLKYCA